VLNAAANSLTAEFGQGCNAVVPQRVAGQDGRVEPIGLLPGVSERTEEWIAALVPQDLTAAGHEVRPEAGRRRDCWIGSIVSEEVAG
jgi:hypothetical protein